MPLAVSQRAWLVMELHRSAGRPPPSPALAAALARRGPVLSWSALDAVVGCTERRIAHLKAVFSAAQLHRNLSELLPAMPAASPPPAAAAQAPQWPRLPAPPPSHPLGASARFEPRIAAALGVAAGSILGSPIPLPGFPFGPRIVGFREALQRPTPAEALVIGGGYVGAEVALGWAMSGAAVTLIEQGPRLMPRFFDAEAAAARALLEDGGVCVRLQTRALGWTERAGRIVTACASPVASHQLAAEVVLIAVGVRRP